MKNLKLFFIVAIFATLLFSSCGPDPKHQTPEEIGVLINGVIWSPYNVGKDGKFANSSVTKACGLYQWNRNDTADFILEAEYLTSAFGTANHWLPANDPSPKGWRVPTYYELQTLLDTEKVSHEWVQESASMRFTDIATGKSIFLPATGIKPCWSDGSIVGLVDKFGCYWSSNGFDYNNAGYLSFHFGNVLFTDLLFKASGVAIRPVADK